MRFDHKIGLNLAKKFFVQSSIYAAASALACCIPRSESNVWV